MEASIIMWQPTKQAYVYIITTKYNTVVYTGVTSDLVKRIYEHKNKLADGFSKKYNLTKLVYFEVTDDMPAAIAREKQLKAGSRKKKEELIEAFNKDWKDYIKQFYEIAASADASSQ